MHRTDKQHPRSLTKLLSLKKSTALFRTGHGFVLPLFRQPTQFVEQCRAMLCFAVVARADYDGLLEVNFARHHRERTGHDATTRFNLIKTSTGNRRKVHWNIMSGIFSRISSTRKSSCVWNRSYREARFPFSKATRAPHSHSSLPFI
jgi:hypothetical protein